MVIASSSLISFARSGLLSLVDRLPLEIVVLDVVWDEVVIAGQVGQHADATGIKAPPLEHHTRRPARKRSMMRSCSLPPRTARWRATT